MHEQAVGRLQLTADMRQALDECQFVVHFQPIVDMTTGHQVSAEALARWRHPLRGLMGPDQFIPLAEETGLIVPMGRSVLRQALQTVAQWQSEIPGCEQMGVAVNLSVRQLLHPDIVEDVREALLDTGIDPHTVVLEITESVLLPDEGVTLDRLNELTALGVQLFIDDFGTGYSSLSYLQQLPVAGIKLAREFVATLGRGALGTDTVASASTTSATGLVSTIRSLAVTLGLQAIVAEGVETPEQRDALLDLGYRLGQGFLMARPMSADAMRIQLEERAVSAFGVDV
jgi:EAL domain-containing protein (putative c-di-GMP-specific phosphodiesterase class I)